MCCVLFEHERCRFFSLGIRTRKNLLYIFDEGINEKSLLNIKDTRTKESSIGNVIGSQVVVITCAVLLKECR
jgi:hypothetical protein